VQEERKILKVWEEKGVPIFQQSLVMTPLYDVVVMQITGRKLIDIVGDGGGYILGVGCSVPTRAKFENLKAMIDTAKNYHPHRKA
jgi:hypothetical protein